MPINLTDSDYDSLRRFQEFCFQNAEKKGFHDEGNALRAAVHEAHDEVTLRVAETNLRNYYGNKMLLIIGEVSEAHDELRSGRAMTETYYPGLKGGIVGPGGKPEGVPSELADTAIRIFDLVGEAGIDLAEIAKIKLSFNQTRPRLHGKEF